MNTSLLEQKAILLFTSHIKDTGTRKNLCDTHMEVSWIELEDIFFLDPSDQY